MNIGLNATDGTMLFDNIKFNSFVDMELHYLRKQGKLIFVLLLLSYFFMLLEKLIPIKDIKIEKYGIIEQEKFNLFALGRKICLYAMEFNIILLGFDLIIGIKWI